VWTNACAQILFSLSPATGAAVAFSSFNARDYKYLLKDAVMISA
jgi:SNF family Na+-dependent transporter